MGRKEPLNDILPPKTNIEPNLEITARIVMRRYTQLNHISRARMLGNGKVSAIQMAITRNYALQAYWIERV